VIRSRSRHHEAPDPEIPDRAVPDSDPAQTLGGADAFERLLGRLSLEQRAVVVLIDGQGHTYAEVSAILGVPIGTVASRLSSAHGRLRVALDTEDAGGPRAAHAELRP
jgi:RNA polymerase sigma-70 factor, ECF subfamily